MGFSVDWLSRRAGKSGRQRLVPRWRGGVGGVHSVEIVVLLVAVATVVAAFAQRLRVPAPSLLVAVGLMVGLLPGAPVVHVPPAVVSLVVLPPLLYAASEELPWRDLRAVWRPVAVLAVGLVLASAAAVAAVAGATGPLPQRDLVLVLAAATIVLSLIVQGFTLEPLARLAGFGPAETLARLRMAEAGLGPPGRTGRQRRRPR